MGRNEKATANNNWPHPFMNQATMNESVDNTKEETKIKGIVVAVI